MSQVINQESTRICGWLSRTLENALRIRIIELLRSQELCVCELCEKLREVSQSKLSFHLKNLKEANLVHSQGRWMYYRPNLAQFVALEQYLAEYRSFGDILP